MRTLYRLILITGFLVINLFSATIEFDVSVVGTTGSGETLYRYMYFLDALTLQQDMEVDIRFNPVLYGVLSNPVAPAEFDLLLLQPNNPPGAFGDYSLLALVDNPPLSGPFSVDFTFKGPGMPGAQPFFINLIDPASGDVTRLDSGSTMPAGGTAVPEPGTFLWGGAGLLTAILTRARKRGMRTRVS